MRPVRRLTATGAAVLTSCLAVAAGATDGSAERAATDRAQAGPMTMRMGRRLGPYRIGSQRAVYPGLVRTIRQARNDGYGCSGTFRQDSYIDVYARLRLGYLRFGGRTSLDTIFTGRTGDRTSVGLTIGRSTLGDVRRRYPRLAVSRHGRGSTITVNRRTGYEAYEYVAYSFNAARRLVGLETGVGGC